MLRLPLLDQASTNCLIIIYKNIPLHSTHLQSKPQLLIAQPQSTDLDHTILSTRKIYSPIKK